MSRLTKPSVIFRERVVPAYWEHLKDPLSERRANTLAEALNNTVEWTYLYLNEVDPEGVLHVQGFNTPFPSEAREAFEYWRKQPD